MAITHLLSKRGKQIGVQDSAVWKDVDALTRLKMRWRSEETTEKKINGTQGSGVYHETNDAPN